MKTGLLYLTESVLLNPRVFKQLVISCFEHFPDRLFVYLRPCNDKLRASCQLQTNFLGISDFYMQCYVSKPSVDVRVLLRNLKSSRTPRYFIGPKTVLVNEDKFDVVFSDENAAEDSYSWSKPVVRINFSDEELNRESTRNVTEDWKIYKNVVIGGTFDHLHIGHKILLTNAILRCTQKLTIGLTTEDMLRKKYLTDLIEPIEVRERKLREFCQDVDSSVEYNIVQISDPFGPSIVDPELEAVVASEETKDGAYAINIKRKEKGLSKLAVHIFPVRDVPGEANAEKLRTISSSWSRQQLLGVLLKRPELKLDLPQRPYLIGLTGGSGSGKTSVGKYLTTKPNTLVIDCDKAAHGAYKMGTNLYKRLVEEYGVGILDKITGEVARVELGKQAARQKLNQLVWPEVMNYCIAMVREANPDVAFFDAALLIEAGWSSRLHEIWVTFVPEDEAVKRIVQRDNLDETSARKRLSTQLSNRTRILHANIVFYTGGEYSATHAQIDRAWAELLRRI